MAKKQNSSDTLILQLQEKIDKQQSELNAISKPNWKTNCSFNYNNVRQNLHVIDAATCITLCADIFNWKQHLSSAYDWLETEKKELVIQGYSHLDWLHDLKLRFEILKKREKEEKLKKLLVELEDLLSHEKKVELRLSKIAESLG